MSWNFNCSQMHRWLQLLGFYSVLWFPFIYLCVFVFWGTNMPSALWFLWSHILSEGLAGPFPGMLMKLPSFTTRPSAGQLYYLSGKLKVLSLWKVVVTSAKVFIPMPSPNFSCLWALWSPSPAWSNKERRFHGTLHCWMKRGGRKRLQKDKKGWPRGS